MTWDCQRPTKMSKCSPDMKWEAWEFVVPMSGLWGFRTQTTALPDVPCWATVQGGLLESHWSPRNKMRRQTVKMEAGTAPESPQGLHEHVKELLHSVSIKAFQESECQWSWEEVLQPNDQYSQGPQRRRKSAWESEMEWERKNKMKSDRWDWQKPYFEALSLEDTEGCLTNALLKKSLFQIYRREAQQSWGKCGMLGWGCAAGCWGTHEQHHICLKSRRLRQHPQHHLKWGMIWWGFYNAMLEWAPEALGMARGDGGSKLPRKVSSSWNQNGARWVQKQFLTLMCQVGLFGSILCVLGTFLLPICPPPSQSGTNSNHSISIAPKAPSVELYKTASAVNVKLAIAFFVVQLNAWIPTFNLPRGL